MPVRQFIDEIDLIAVSPRETNARLRAGWLEMPCALGARGLLLRKREGDGATPVGVWPMRRAFYRADRLPPPATALPLRPIRPADGWCDAPGDRRYNRPVMLPYPASAESMWREDHLYDIVIVLGHNDSPARPGLGSAVFMHLARPDFGPTRGCIALAPVDMLKLIARCRPGTMVRVGGR